MEGFRTRVEGSSAQDKKERSFKYFLTDGWGVDKRELETACGALDVSEAFDGAYYVVFDADGSSKMVFERRGERKFETNRRGVVGRS